MVFGRRPITPPPSPTPCDGGVDPRDPKPTHPVCEPFVSRGWHSENGAAAEAAGYRKSLGEPVRRLRLPRSLPTIAADGGRRAASRWRAWPPRRIRRLNRKNCDDSHREAVPGPLASGQSFPSFGVSPPGSDAYGLFKGISAAFVASFRSAAQALPFLDVCLFVVFLALSPFM